MCDDYAIIYIRNVKQVNDKKVKRINMDMWEK